MESKIREEEGYRLIGHLLKENSMLIVKNLEAVLLQTGNGSLMWQNAVWKKTQKGNDVIVVLSAMGDTTDELIAKAKRSIRMHRDGKWICY